MCIFRLAKHLSGKLHSQGDVTSLSEALRLFKLGGGLRRLSRGCDPLWDGDEVKLTGLGLWLMRNVKQPEKELNR